MATYGECVDCVDAINTAGQDWCDSCLGLTFSAEGKFGNNEALNKEEREKVQEIVKRIKQEINELELRNTIPSTTFNLLKLFKTQSSLMNDYFSSNRLEFHRRNVRNKKKTVRVKPRYPIEYWSVYERVLKNQPNHVETWHSAIKGGVQKNMNLFKVLELLQNEQSNTENCRKYIERANDIRARLSRKEELIEKLVKSYVTNNLSDWKSLLESIAANT